METVSKLLQMHFLFLFIKFTSAFHTSSLSPYLVNSFPRTPNKALSHFTVSVNRSVYIGAVNSLYHLSQYFEIQSQVKFENEEDPNVNKILEIIPFPVEKLVSCGTGLNGACQLRNLNNISQDVIQSPPIPLKVASKNYSTVGLVVKEASEMISLYVAQTVGWEDPLTGDRGHILSICLHKGNQNGCPVNDKRETRNVATAVPSDFIIHHVAVFSYEGYTYYVASQRKNAMEEESEIVPKISRVCHNDTSEDLSGFTEITLECQGKDGSLYSIAQSAAEVNGLLYIAFVKNIPEKGNNFNPENQSALCIYEMENLKTEFEDSTINCSCQGERMGSNNNYLSNSRCGQVVDCVTAEMFTCFLPPDLLSRYPERSPFLASLPGLLIFENNGDSFSSIMLIEIDRPVPKKVAFIGTKEGSLLKVHFDADLTSPGVLYEILDMGFPVLADTWINPEGETAIFLTEKQLLEIRLANCSKYETCEECIKPDADGGDPHCGWCTLERRCTKYEQCKSSNIPSRWLWYNETKCPSITDIMPSSLSVDVHSQMVGVTVSMLPNPTEFNYTCHFGASFTSAASYTNGLITCLSPGITDIPRIPNKDDAVEVTFSISSTELSISFLSTSYPFFNCSRIRGCRDCVTKWTCDWCIDELLCTYNLNNMCHNITSQQDNSSYYCPLLASAEMLIPSGVSREVSVTARNLNLTTGLLQREYECVIDAEEVTGNTVITKASFQAESDGEYTVTCSTTLYSYSLEEQEITVFLRLRWMNTHIFLDGTIKVTLFKCDIDRPDCSRCLSNLTTRPKFECGWCIAPQGFCAVEENCSFKLLRECLDPPQILSVSPTSSSIEGGTIVEISGSDLGQRFSDIINVSLAEVVCHHQNYFNNYQVGESLMCETGNTSTARQGTVSLFLLNKTEVVYGQFSYNDPRITSFYPMAGPQSGGTLITIEGTQLHTGRERQVVIGKDTCNILKNSPTTIVCQNGGLAANESVLENQTVFVKFDDNRRLATEEFTYHADPIVTEIAPQRAIISGGNMLTVYGERLHLIQEPKIRFTIGFNSSDEECFFNNQNELEIICKSPSIAAILEQRKRRADSAAEGTVAVGFIMDGVTNLLDWSQNNDVVFQYYKDPVYDTFEGVLNYKQTTNNLLTLNGTNLTLASSIQDVTVYVGTEFCIVKTLDTNRLICELPSKQPEPGDLYGNKSSNDLPFIIVRHANLEFRIGYIRYTDTLLILWYIIAAVCALIILTVIILIVSTWYIRRKKTEKIRDLEMQFRNIHESVSANLKTLFATLQTTMNDFETALTEEARVPFLDKRQYLLQMMFLGMEVKPSSSPPEEITRNSTIKCAMEKFSEFLYHKSFLKVLVTTMDNTSGISIMERANVGSLLSICLLQNGKLELYSSLIMSLMQEQIEDCDGKGKQRILFSRNDTMLEKLISNWLVIFLYEFLKQHAASECYQLYEAIKYVCEMGPIDAVSGKSQFSINDQEMLETQIDFNEVELDVITNSDSGEKESLRVLDVNTVTQVKERIISHNNRDLPYSQRPSPFTFDLVWKAGTSGQLILRDDENQSEAKEKGWIKINTLKDYNVPSNSTFELVTKHKVDNADVLQNERGRQADGNGHLIHLYLQHDLNAASNYEMSQTKRKSHDVSVWDGVKLWHLIKEDQEDFSEEGNKKEPRLKKEIKEVVLPFLPATRTYIQKYVDGLFDAIFAANHGADVPLSIKYLFQFFDQEAEKGDKPELAKAWKNNVLPLRYWSTIIANPQYVLDVGVYTYTHASLRILVQVIKDACVGRVKVYKDKDFSPSRLLFSNFIEGYISKLNNYYLFIRNSGRVDSEDLRQECEKVEKEFQDAFDLISTQQKLFKLVKDHQQQLIDALEEDDICKELSFPAKLQSVGDMMEQI